MDALRCDMGCPATWMHLPCDDAEMGLVALLDVVGGVVFGFELVDDSAKLDNDEPF
jgi:hypothetical protein